MATQRDTVTFKLDGEVTLEAFATAIERFHTMLSALSDAEAQGVKMEWVVEDLAPGSMTATFKGRALGTRSKRDVARVVRRFPEIGDALSANRNVGLPRDVIEPALAIGGLINGRIRRVVFQTPDVDTVVSSRPEGTVRAARWQGGEAGVRANVPTKSQGALQGHVHTVTSRGGYRFTMYEALTDHAVSCYLSEESKEMMRDAWGRLCVIEGTISRDRQTGDPLAVRNITDIHILPEGDRPHLRARGAGPKWTARKLTAADAIRRIRNA